MPRRLWQQYLLHSPSGPSPYDCRPILDRVAGDDEIAPPARGLVAGSLLSVSVQIAGPKFGAAIPASSKVLRMSLITWSCCFPVIPLRTIALPFCETDTATSPPRHSQMPPHLLQERLNLLLTQRPPRRRRRLQVQLHPRGKHDPLPGSAVCRSGTRFLPSPCRDDLDPFK